jgi:antitoxin component of MazEF toxin-antitoxin module
MSVATFEGEIVNGKILLPKNVVLPKTAKFSITILEKSDKKKKFDLAEMVSRMPKDYSPNEEDFGKPSGKEVW